MIEQNTEQQLYIVLQRLNRLHLEDVKNKRTNAKQVKVLRTDIKTNSCMIFYEDSKLVKRYKISEIVRMIEQNMLVLSNISKIKNCIRV